MAEGRNIFVGILAIILGLLVIAFPLISVSTFSVLAGVGIIFLGIWLLTQSFKVWGENLAAGISDLILGFFALCFGMVFIGNIAALSFLTFLALYIVGFFLLLTGITALFSGADLKARGVGVLGIIFGVVYLLLGIYVGNPLFLAIIIGAFLIIAGLMEIFAPPPITQ